MIDMKDFVDITPQGVLDGIGRKGAQVIFQDKELKMLQENPGRLTKEGVQKKVELWKKSNNRNRKVFIFKVKI